MTSTSWAARQTRTGVIILSLAALTVWLVLAVPARAQTETPCTVPDALRTAGLLSQAEAVYQELRAAAKPDPCAAEGLATIRRERTRRAAVFRQSLDREGVDERTAASLAAAVRGGREEAITSNFKSQVAGGSGFAIARALRRAGYRDAAADVVAARLVAKPDAEVPRDLRLLSDAGQHLAAALALSRAGLDDAANEQLKAALQEDPTLDVPEELAAPDRRRPAWRELLGEIGPWLRTIAEIVVLVLAAAALILLAVRFAKRVRSRVVIDSFTGGPDGAGEATAVAVRENYGRLRAGPTRRDIKMVASSGERSAALPKEVAEAYPQTAIIAAMLQLIDRLLPSRTRQVTGYLRPRDPRRGAGLTVALARQYGKVFDEITVWESEYGPLQSVTEENPQPAYDRVVIPAAAWLLFNVRRYSLWRRLRIRGAFEVQGTKEWRSYALFAVGAEDYARGDAQSACVRYLQALRRDQANRGAKANLAVAELQTAGEDQDAWGRAGKRLDELQAAIESDGHYDKAQLWYRVRYTQTVAAMHPQWGNSRTARKAAVSLCAKLLAKTDKLKESKQLLGSSKALQAFLRTAEPRALIVLASALRHEGRPPTKVSKQPPVDRNTLKEQLNAFAAKPDDGSTSDSFNNAVTHAGVIAYVIDEWSPLDPEAAYDLACYYTRTRQWEEAEKCLLQAVELLGAGVGKWALKDPALTAYRADQSRLERLKKLMGRLADPKPPSATDGTPPKTVVERLLDAIGA